MKLPKSVVIAGRPWPVISDKTIEGGMFTSDPGIIKIGPHGSEDERLNILIHEILEAILTIRNHRYQSYPDQNDLYVFNHREFIGVARDVGLALRGFLK